MILSIDPGKKHAGCALFEDGELINAYLVKADKDLAQAQGWPLTTAMAIGQSILDRFPPGMLEVCVYEQPKVYRTMGSRDKANDLLELAVMSGSFIGLYSEKIERICTYLPKEWKGTVPKNVMIKRIIGRLSDEEKSRVELPKNKARQTDVWDAVGIGLKYVGRL